MEDELELLRQGLAELERRILADQLADGAGTPGSIAASNATALDVVRRGLAALERHHAC